MMQCQKMMRAKTQGSTLAFRKMMQESKNDAVAPCESKSESVLESNVLMVINEKE